MRCRISFPKRILCFEALEQKRPLATDVLSCGEADPEAVVAEEAGESQQTVASAMETDSGSENEDRIDGMALGDEKNELENEESSNGQSRHVESSDERGEDESDELDDDSSDDDDDEVMTDDESDVEDEESDEDEIELGDDESDDDEESDDDDDAEEEDDDVDDEEDQANGDSDEGEDDSEEDDDELEDDDDSDEDEQDNFDEDDDVENEADDDTELMLSSVDRQGEDGAALKPDIGSDVTIGAPALVGFQGTVANSSQVFRGVRSGNREPVDENLIELLQVRPGNPSRDGRELAFDEIVALANNGMIEPSGPFMNDKITRATLQGPLQPAFVDAVFTSLG